MKKSLIALAVMAVAGAASAQSSVNITGLVGVAYQSVDQGTAAAAAANLAVPGSAVVGGASRGFTLTDVTLNVGVTEDLGGGMKVAVNVGLDSIGSTSTSNFAQPLLRRTTSMVASGGFGSVAFLNTRSGNLLTKGMVAPTNFNDGLYDTSGVISRVAVDAVQYMTPTMSGFNGYVQWVEGGTDGSTTPALGISVLGANYASGPLAAGLAYKSYNGLAAGVLRTTRLELFATYDFGVAKVGFGYDGANVGTAVANAINDAAATAIGVSVPLGAITVGANFAKRDANTVNEFVAKYDLSKRTSFNASFGRQSLDAQPAIGTDGSQYRIGMYHTF
jgi:predicted porin